MHVFSFIFLILVFGMYSAHTLVNAQVVEGKQVPILHVHIILCAKGAQYTIQPGTIFTLRDYAMRYIYTEVYLYGHGRMIAIAFP